MQDKLIRALANNWLNRVAIQTGVTVAMGSILCCLGTVILAIPDTIIDPDLKGLLLMGAFVGVIGLFVVGVFVWLFLNNQRIYARFDQAFAVFGLSRSRYLLRGLQYQGDYRGRPVNVYYYVSGGRYVRVPNLEIYVGGGFGTRLGIGNENALSRLGGSLSQQQPLNLNDPAYVGLLIYALDEKWSRQLLAHPQARPVIEELVGQETAGVRGLLFGPESVRLQIRHFSLAIITPETVAQWVNGLWALAELAEKLPSPTQTVEASNWEKQDRVGPSRVLGAIMVAIILVALCPAILAACVLGIMVLQRDFP